MNKIVIINDIHFGIKDSKRLYDELHQFTDYIESNPVDMVMFNGDFFDLKLAVGDLATFYAMSFFQKVITICKEKKIIVRMIQGTRSHDLNQLCLFEPFTRDRDIDFKIYETVQEEEILGKKILFLPEEYPENFKTYYDEYKTKKYDILFGHGTWDFLSFGAEKKESAKGVRQAPIFIFDEWQETLKEGVAVFGHIHGRTIHKDKVFYPGSFTRWGYGELGDRGFSVLTVDDSSWSLEFINNTEAPIYSTASVKEICSDMDTMSAADIISLITEQVKNNDHLRIDLSGLSADKIEIIKKSLSENANIKVEVREARTLLKESSDSERFKKYEYITKRQLPLNKTIQRFCKEELSKDLTLEVIDKILRR
jgi:DNA repair exonuclease SbcCD nuclease subunit